MTAFADRRPGVAALLNGLLPGLGNLYAGQPRVAGAVWLGAVVAGWLSIYVVLWADEPSPYVSLVPWATVIAVTLSAIGLGWWGARRAPRPYALRRYNNGWVYLWVLVGGTAAGWGVRELKLTAFEAFHITSGSMEPTLYRNDLIYVDKRGAARSPERGDITVFASPENPVLTVASRVVAIGGDTVAMRLDSLFLNGDYVPEVSVMHVGGNQGTDPRMTAWQGDYLVGDDVGYAPTLSTWGPIAVPDGRFVFLGDNRYDAYDSRYVGFGRVEDVIGRAHCVYWSFDANGVLPLPAITGVRWARLGQPWGRDPV